MTTLKMCFHNPSRNISDEERAVIEQLGYQLEADIDCPHQYMYFMSKEIPDELSACATCADIREIDSEYADDHCPDCGTSRG